MLTPKKNQKSAAMAALLEEYEGKADAAPTRTLAPGDSVGGVVAAVGPRTVIVDLGAKMQGLIDRAEFEDGVPPPAVGERIDAYFAGMEDGAARLVLRGGADGVSVDESIQTAMAAKLPVEGTFEKEVSGGYEVKVRGQRAFCPFSQVALHRPREGAPSPVGTTSTFLVMEYDPEARNLVVSHRALEERDQAVRRETLRSSLFEGDVRFGTVTRLMPFGVFVDLGGVEGLIPNSEVSWDRSVKASDVLHEGDGVQVKIRRVDWENDRFTLSLKDVGADPWQEYCEDFSAGSWVTGKVIKLMPFGAFVQLVPGVDGLLPISALGRGRHIVDPGEVVKVGEELDLRIESMDPVARRISLSLVDKRVAALKPGEIAVGARLKGIVESVRDFGVFVRLSEDKTGLLHVSETGVPKGGNNVASLEAKFPVGSELDVVVKGVDGERVSLTLPAAVEAAESAARDEMAVRNALRENREASASGGFGNLGSLFDAAIGG